MKLTKEQRRALIEKIKAKASLEVTEQRAQIETSFVEPPEIEKYRELLINFSTAFIKAEKAKQELLGDPDSEIMGIYNSSSPRDPMWVTNRVARFKRTLLDKKIAEEIVTYDFTSIESDLILAELDGSDIDDLISNALLKYVSKK